MNILNDMNRTDDNEVKNIAAWNFLYGILNYSKSTKNINIHYYTILHGYINICGGKSRYNIFWILLDGVSITTIAMRNLIRKLKTKRWCDEMSHKSS